ncbi:HCLS1-associated protein X-1-like [Ptychodera flava]|uniref:HCLS1-associated protein X-1-like n=1 Tax=Ptychodera flava TaxID=63121 RepID=UPI003969E5FC
MNFHDFFGNIFGFPRHRRPPRDDDDEDEHGGIFGFHGFHDDGADEDQEHGDSHGDFFGDPFQGLARETEDMFRHFERHFNEMFKNFGLAEFPPISESEIGGKVRSLRDEMLKKPNAEKFSDAERKPLPFDDSKPFFKEWHWNLPYRLPRSTQPPTRDEKRDRDLDGEISAGNLDAILPGGNQSPDRIVPDQPQSRSFFRSVSVTKVRKPDGSIEERRTVRDDKGNVETTVTTIDADGIRQSPSGAPEIPINAPRRPVVQEPILPDGSKSIFEKLFGKR